MAYTPLWRQFEPTMAAEAQQVIARYPGAWAKAKAPHDDGEFIKRLAERCHAVEPNCGLNYKRGEVGVYSKDILAFPNASGCRDGSNIYPGLELVDVIIGHESPSAAIGWLDVTPATIAANAIGAWVKPVPVGGTPVPQPPDPCKACREELAGVKAELAALKASTVAKVSYPGDAVWDRFGLLYADDVARAGQALNALSFRWAGRTMHDDYMEGLTLEQSIAKHRAEWCAVLGIPVL